MPSIASLKAREIFDSRGTPTVEVDALLSDGSFGRASVPSGASTGVHEAVELRDEHEQRLGGKGVMQAVRNVVEIILPALQGKDVDQSVVDRTMLELDGTQNKSKLGANAILGVSIAVAKATAASQRRPLWEYFRDLSSTAPQQWTMPVPMMNILNGGKHANNSSDFQEFMIMPVGAHHFRQAMDMGATVFMKLKKMLHDTGHATTVGDEGGFAPSLSTNQAALDLIAQAIEQAGYQLGTDIVLALDVAASEFYADGKYTLATEQRTVTPAELIAMYSQWIQTYPIKSIEDGLDQDAWADTQTMTVQLGNQIQIVGDDLFVTNVERLQHGIQEKVANSILIKLNQIGTITETVAAIDLARQNGYTAIVSHRSGETEDTTIADFVVGLGTGQIKTGSLSRSERLAKYNQLLRIEEVLSGAAIYPGMSALQK